MKYEGKVYGKVGGKYIELEGADSEAMQSEIKTLQDALAVDEQSREHYRRMAGVLEAESESLRGQIKMLSDDKAALHAELKESNSENDRLREALKIIASYLQGGYPEDQLKDIGKIVEKALEQ